MTSQDLPYTLPEERNPALAIMRNLAKRRKSLSAVNRFTPAKVGEGFHTTNTLADSESSGDGTNVPAIGSPNSGQN